MALILKQEANANVTTPPSGSGAVFLNSGDQLVVKDSTGNNSTIPTFTATNNTSVFFNDAGVLGESANLTFVKTTNALTVTNGNVVAGGVKTDNLYYANGNPWDLQQPGGSNTQIQFNDADSFGGSAAFIFNKTSNLVTVSANLNANNLNATTHITSGNVWANSGIIGAQTLKGEGGNISNIQGGNVSGTVSSATTAGTVTTAAQPNITSVGTLSSLAVTANVTAGNVYANSGIIGAQTLKGEGGNISNIQGANVSGTVATATTAGTVTTAAQPNITSVGTLTSLTVTGNVSGGNLTTGGVVSATGNVSGGNLTTGGALSVTGNANVGNIGAVNGVFTGNVSASTINATGIANGTSNLAIPTASGNVNISAAGNANVFVVTGSGILTTGTVNAAGNINGHNLTTDGALSVTGNANVGNIGASAGIFTANITTSSGNIYANSGTIGASLLTGTLTTASQPNITSVGTLSSLTVTGTASAGNLSTGGNLSVSGNAVISGNLTVDGNLVYVNVETLAVEDPIIQLQSGPNGAAPSSNSGKDVGTGLNYYDTQARIAFMGWDVSNAEFGMASQASITNEVVTFTSYGNLRVGNIIGNGQALTGLTGANVTGQVANALVAGTVYTAAQPNITSVGTLTSVAVTGNVTAGNVYANSGTIGASVLAGTLSTAAQPNITSVGTLSSLTVSGNASAGNLNTAGKVVASTLESNVATGTAPFVVASTTKVANLNADTLDGYDTATAATANTVVVRNADGNIAANNISGTLTTASQTNITSVGTLGSLAVTANVTAGNVYANSGTIGAQTLKGEGGNISNIQGANVSGTVSSATTAGTVTTAAQPNITSVGTLTSVSVTGNATAGNVYANSGTIGASLLTGTLTTAAQPNITSVGTLTSATVTGNVAAGNLTTTGVLSVTGTGQSSIAGNLDMTGNTIANLATPTNPTDAATKQYVDDVAQGLNIHDSVQAATPNTLAVITGGTITYNNGTNGVGATLTTTGTFNLIDGVNVQTAGTRILVKNEANAVFNGIYTYTNTTAITRALDYDTVPEVEAGDFVFCTGGTLYDNTGWVQTDSPAAIGTAGNTITFTQFSGAGTYQAGTGLTLSGTIFSISNTAVTAASYGNGDRVASFTVNAQGQLTAASNVVIAANAANLTGTTLASSIVTSSLTSVGTLGSLAVTGNATAGNVYANSGTIGASLLTGTLTTAAQPNITSVGTLTSLTVSGNASAGNLNTAGKVVASTLESNVATGTAPFVVASTTKVANLNADLLDGYSTDTAATANTVVIRDTNGSFSANVVTANLSGNATTAGTVVTAAQPNITSVGTLTSVAVTGNVTAGNVYANSGTIGASLLTGTLTTAAQPNITSVGTLTSVAVTGNVTAGNVYANSGTLGASLLTGTLTTAAQPNITSVGTLTSVAVTGNVTAGNVYANSGTIGAQTLKGEGGNISNIQGANVSGTVATATTAGTVTTAAQPNITSVGTLTSLAVTGNTTSGNFVGRLANGNSNVNIATANGNVNISAVGNANVLVVTGTGVNVAGTINSTGNLTTGGELSVSGNAVVTGNLYINGNLTYLNTETLSVEDPIINLQTGANGAAPVANSGKDVGTALNYYDTQARIAFMGWDVSNAEFGMASVATISSEVVTFSTYGNLRVGNIIGNGQALTGLAGANVTGQVGNALVAGTVYTAAQPNITSVGTLTSLAVTGNANVGNIGGGTGIFTTGNITTVNTGLVQNGNSNVAITANGNVTISAVGGARITATSTGANVTGTLGVSGNANVGNIGATTAVITTGNITTVNTGLVQNGTSNIAIVNNGDITLNAGGFAIPQLTISGFSGTSVNGNLSAGNVSVTGQLISTATTGTAPLVVSSTTQVANLNAATAGTAGTVTTAAQPNITSVGTLTSLAVTGNVSGGNLTTAGAVVASTLTSNVATGTAPLTVTSTTRVANLNVAYANVADFVNVTAPGTGTGYVMFANATTGNVAEYTSSGITANLANNSITATTFVGALSGAATTAGTVTTNAQPNITSTGTLTSLTVSGAANIQSTTAATSTTTGALIVAGGIGANGNSYMSNMTVKSNVAYVAPNGANTITNQMLNGGTLAWSGNAGQLFSITDSMTGNIFTVNDVSGIPMISVDAGGNIQFAVSGGFVNYGVTTSISANGSTQGTATALTRPINVVSTVSASTGVILPTVPAGARIIIMNTSATALNVYPPTGAAINSGATNAAYSQPAGARLEYISTSTTQWYTMNATYG